MKELISKTTLCDSAALRVQGWFGQDKQHLPNISDRYRTSEGFCKKYRCNRIRTPELVPQVEHLPLYGYLLVQKTKPKSAHRTITSGSSGSLQGIVRQSQGYIEPEIPSGGPLSHRVVHSKFKEHFVVSKKLKSLSKQNRSGPKNRSITPIKSKT